MKRLSVISGAVVGIVLVIGFAVGGLANIFQGPLQRGKAVIVITGTPGSCKAATTPGMRPNHMQGKRSGKVEWEIQDRGRCLRADEEVELRFTNGNPLWFFSRPNGKIRIDKRIQWLARIGEPYYKYEVWAVGEATEYKMEDPELEIVQ